MTHGLALLISHFTLQNLGRLFCLTQGSDKTTGDGEAK